MCRINKLLTYCWKILKNISPRNYNVISDKSTDTYRRRTPPSNDALRHSGGDRRRCTSATVTLYLDVELRRDNRPGTEQNTSDC